MLRRWCQRAGACLPSSPPPREREVCVKIRAYHNTQYVPVHNIAVNPPPRERSVWQDACVSQHTFRAGAQHRRSTRNPRTAAIHVTERYGWCADAHHHLRPRRCMNSNPQRVMRCAGAHHQCRPRRCVDSNHRRVIRYTTTLVHAGAWTVTIDSLFHCRPRRYVDSNHRRVIRCAGAHHHARPCRCMDRNHRLVIPLSSTPVRRQYSSTRYSVCRRTPPLSSTPVRRQ